MKISEGPVSCRICGNERDNSRFRIREMMFDTREEFDYFQCGSCGCLQIERFPVDISHYYSRGYYSLKPGFARMLAFHLRDEFAFTGKSITGRMVFYLYPNYALSHISRLCVPLSARILDIGCGSGLMIDCLTRNGFNNVTGIDPYLDSEVILHSGARLKKASIEDVKGQWDLVMFHHSLEHLPDPLSALTHAQRLLARDGMCLVRVPTVSSYAWERYGTDWVQLDAPRHFFLFSTAALELLSRKAGFDVGNITYDSTPLQLWGSEQYAMDIPLFSRHSLMKNPFARTFSRAQKRDFRLLTRRLNEEERGDQIALVLKPEPPCGKSPRFKKGPGKDSG
jgi:SAM-dependent methyltransferase